MASDVSCRAQTSLQQSGTSVITQLEMLKLKLKVTQYKAFQLAAIEALQDGKDTIQVWLFSQLVLAPATLYTFTQKNCKMIVDADL